MSLSILAGILVAGMAPVPAQAAAGLAPAKLSTPDGTIEKVRRYRRHYHRRHPRFYFGYGYPGWGYPYYYGPRYRYYRPYYYRPYYRRGIYRDYW